MPDNVETPPSSDAPVVLSQEQIVEQATTKGLEAAAAMLPPTEPLEAPDPDAPPADEPPADAPPADEPPADTPPADEPPADTPPADVPPVIATEDMTDEQRDEADARSLGFKNQRANTEFKAMRAELRTLRPLQDELADVKPLADRWTKTYQYLQANNIQPDRFAQGMAMLAGTESQDVAILEKTLGGLEMEADRIREKLGIGGGSFDPLKLPENADLARAVENEEMAPQWAQQQARLRAENKHRATVDQTQRQTQQQQTELNGARTKAIADLDAIDAEYRAIDPQFAAKADILVTALKPVFARLHPSEWPATFRAAYTELKLAPAVGIPATPTPPPIAPLRGQPLRPGAPAAAQTREVKTEDDAIEAALRNAAALDGVPYRPSA